MIAKMDLAQLQDIKRLYKRVFSTDDGIKVLEDMKQRFFFDKSTFSNQPHEIAYNEGQRTVVMFLENMMTDIEKVEQMKQQQEALNE